MAAHLRCARLQCFKRSAVCWNVFYKQLLAASTKTGSKIPRGSIEKILIANRGEISLSGHTLCQEVGHPLSGSLQRCRPKVDARHHGRRGVPHWASGVAGELPDATTVSWRPPRDAGPRPSTRATASSSENTEV
uniref:Uncharacterized protein n=1 Tax=Ixodes ricinus TaxID=34613 RepID=A0A0K8RLD9_IXORI